MFDFLICSQALNIGTIYGMIISAILMFWLCIVLIREYGKEKYRKGYNDGLNGLNNRRR